MTDRWALVNPETLVVDNVVIWGGGETLWPTFNTIQLNEREPCGHGWVYDPTPMANPRFTDPNPVIPEEIP